MQVLPLTCCECHAQPAKGLLISPLFAKIYLYTVVLFMKYVCFSEHMLLENPTSMYFAKIFKMTKFTYAHIHVNIYIMYICTNGIIIFMISVIYKTVINLGSTSKPMEQYLFQAT